MKTPHRYLSPLLVVGAISLAACGQAEQDTSSAGQMNQPPVAQTEQQPTAPMPAPNQGNDAAPGAATPGGATPSPDAGRAVAEAARGNESRPNDATITAQVTAALATDPQLSSVRIDVDTQDGVVTLTGPAPDEKARVRATQLAAAPEGVVRVENRLRVESS
jgi:hypothetical protein